MKINQLSLKQAHVISSNTFPVGKRYKIKLGRVNVETGKRRLYFSTVKLYNSPTLEKDYQGWYITDNENYVNQVCKMTYKLAKTNIGNCKSIQ